jgi:two-component system copper resistance phosphate regulon response regulator CusR
MPDSILLVDDEEAVLDAFQTLLTRNGYLVRSAPDLTSVESACSCSTYSVAIVDLTLAGGEREGMEVLRYLTRQAARPRIIVWSGRSTDDVKERVLNAGADIFLAKPVAFNMLMERIHELLRPMPHRVQQENAQLGPAPAVPSLLPRPTQAMPQIFLPAAPIR